MTSSLTTEESLRIAEIIQETELEFDEECNGNIESYDEDYINLIFEFEDPEIDDHYVKVDRQSMTVL